MKSQGDKMKLILDKEINLKEANTFTNRLLGLMFKTNIQEGLVFKTKAIHTFFMKENIDVIMCDKNNVILYYYSNLKKNKIILPKKNVYKVYETPANFFNIKISDKMEVKK